MNKISIEMPIVSKCVISHCAYNSADKCHARAITVGDQVTPGCDTFLASKVHTRHVSIIAGVGACKVSGCKYNQDYECTVSSIEVGYVGDRVVCMTYST